MKIFIISMGIFFVLGCGTISSRRSAPLEGPSVPPPVTSGVTTSLPQYRPLDVMERLKLSASFEGIGFHQTAFNPCDIGLASKSCSTHYVSAINFQLLCRASQGTTELVTQAELSPLSYGDIKWKLGSRSGYGQTDGQGYGQINLVTRSSAKGRRLIIISKGQTLGLRAGQVRKIVLPQDWCY